MTNKIKTAIEIFKATLPEAKGRFSARISEIKRNEVEILSDGILYCTVNVSSGTLKGI